MKKLSVAVRGREYIRTQTAQPFDLKLLLGELIDNALDAQASQVRLDVAMTEHKQSLIVLDDGKGVPQITDMFDVGRSQRHGSDEESGIHGVGFKDAAIHLGGRTTVFSSRDGRASEWATCNWSDTDDAGFVVQVQTFSEHEWRRESKWQTGTQLKFERINAERYPLARWKRLYHSEDLDEMFWPAVEAGKVITLTLNGSTRTLSGRRANVATWHHPSPVAVVTRDDREMTCRAGSLAQASPLAGVTVIRGYRVLRTAWLGPTANAATLYAEIVLPGGATSDRQTAWAPNRNKTGLLHQRDRDQIADALAPILRPLVEREKARQWEVHIDDLSETLTGLMTSVAAGADLIDPSLRQASRRANEHASGTVAPTGTGTAKKRTRFPKPDAGTRIPVHGGDRKAAGVHVQFQTWGEPDTVWLTGSVETETNPWIVTLNNANPYIGQFVSWPDVQRRALGLGVATCALLAFEVAAWDHDRRQRRLPAFSDVNAKGIYERLLSSLQSEMLSGQMEFATA